MAEGVDSVTLFLALLVLSPIAYVLFALLADYFTKHPPEESE